MVPKIERDPVPRAHFRVIDKAIGVAAQHLAEQLAQRMRGGTCVLTQQDRAGGLIGDQVTGGYGRIGQFPGRRGAAGVSEASSKLGKGMILNAVILVAASCLGLRHRKAPNFSKGPSEPASLIHDVAQRAALGHRPAIIFQDLIAPFV